MLRSFVTLTFRTLWRNKVTSAINIFSLTIGISAFILIMLYVHHELSYDKFNENYDRIYRLQTENYAKFPPIIGEHLKNQVAEIENIARISIQGNGKELISYTQPGRSERPLSIQAYSYFADSSIFDVFTLPFIRGKAEIALSEPFTIVLTENVAHRLFGNRNPMGEVIDIGDYPYQVTGVIRNVNNSHIDIEVLKSYESFLKIHEERNLNRIETSSQLWSATYILSTRDYDNENLKKEINIALNEINDVRMFMIEFQEFNVLPLSEIYFNGSTANLQYGKQGNLQLVKTFTAIAIFILALASFNYINLSTARAIFRSKEVALKKIVGSSGFYLKFQFILESILVTFISFIAAIAIVVLFITQFNQLALINISLSELNKPMIWAISLVGILILGIISGFYPAAYITQIETVSLIKGFTTKGVKGASIRHALLTFQFSISIVLIIGIITNLRQLHYARNLDLGFNQEQIVLFSTPDLPGQKKHEARRTFKEKLLQNQNINKISFTVGRMGTQLIPAPDFVIDGKEGSGLVFMVIDPDYLGLMDIKLIEGRNFSWDIQGDRNYRMIVNQTAAKHLSQDSSIVGKIAYYTNPHQPETQLQMEIIGVVKDFHYQSVHHSIEPMCFAWFGPESNINIKISADNVPQTLSYIENVWKETYGAEPFQYSFLDSLYDQQYENDEKGAKIIGYFTVLAMIIACMGLFALSSFISLRKTKEIGVRKVLGATTKSLFIMQSGYFLKWVFISAIIACPIAWFIMSKWLEGFAYKIELGIDIFILGILISMFVAFITVVWQVTKSALLNPAKALRYE